MINKIPTIIDFNSEMTNVISDVGKILFEIYSDLQGPYLESTGYENPDNLKVRLSNLALVGLVPPGRIDKAYSIFSSSSHFAEHSESKIPRWPSWWRSSSNDNLNNRVPRESAIIENGRPAYSNKKEKGLRGCADFFGIYLDSWRDAVPEIIPFEPTSTAGSDNATISDGPAILLCPRNIEKIYKNLVSTHWPLSPLWPLSENPHREFFRMTLLHEIGHHLWPIHQRNERPHEAEAMANGLVYQLSDYRTRKYLFYKSRLLQSPEYGTYLLISHRNLWNWLAQKQHDPLFEGAVIALSKDIWLMGPFWTGSPCCLFQSSQYMKYEYTSIKAAAIEDYLTSLLIHGYWSDEDHNGFHRKNSLKDLEVIHAIYETVLGHDDVHPEMRHALFEAASRGPRSHRNCPDKICFDPESIAAGRVLAFRYSNSREGREIIKKSLLNEIESDCHNWIRWGQIEDEGMERIRPVVIPILKAMAFSKEKKEAEMAKDILSRWHEDFPDHPIDFDAWKETNEILNRIKKEVNSNFPWIELSEIYSTHPLEFRRAIADRWSEFSPDIQRTLYGIIEHYPPVD
jgi:hypothetical protein